MMTCEEELFLLDNVSMYTVVIKSLKEHMVILSDKDWLISTVPVGVNRK